MLNKYLSLGLGVFAIFLCSKPVFSEPTESKNTKIVRHQASGNLEVTHVIACGDISKLDNKNTAADLYAAVGKCLKANNPSEAAAMFALAGAYARFDQERVADKTAHQALEVLLIDSLKQNSEHEKQEFQEALKLLTSPESQKLPNLCKTFRAIGAPDYYPRYMIQHGMGAFVGEQKNQGLVENFEKGEAWEKVLDTYLHCPKA